MPPGRYPSEDELDISMLNPQALDAPDGLLIALRAIELVCHRGDPEIATTVAALSSRPYILEYIISGALHVPIGPCVLPPLINSPCSVGGGNLREVLEMDNCRVPHVRDAEHYGSYEYAAPPEIFVFIVICGVSIRYRYTS